MPIPDPTPSSLPMPDFRRHSESDGELRLSGHGGDGPRLSSPPLVSRMEGGVRSRHSPSLPFALGLASPVLRSSWSGCCILTFVFVLVIQLLGAAKPARTDFQ